MSVRDFVRDNMLTLLQLNQNKDIADMEYISNIIDLYHDTKMNNHCVFYVLSRLVLTKDNLTDVDDIDNFTIVEHLINDLNYIIINLHDNDDIILEITPSEADMISSALYYALEQLRTSNIDVFNHGVNDMDEDECFSYKAKINSDIKHIAENLTQMAEEETGTIVIKRPISTNR